ncbi:MAG: ABC transporter substrate-binding protein, partial [Desulfobacterales bacterium]
MKRSKVLIGLVMTIALCFLVGISLSMAADKIVIGHPACLSGKYAKAGEQAIGGIKGCIDWVNNVYGGVKIAGKKVPLTYKYYDCESKKEAVTSLIGRLITVDKVSVVFSPYSSGLTLRGAPVTESHQMLYMDHGGANNKIFQQGFRYVVQTIGPASSYHQGTLEMIHKIDPKAKKVALAYEDSEFAKMVMQGAEEHAKKLGFDIVFKRTYPKGVTDLTPLLSAMKATKPDFIIGGGHFEDGQLFNRQMADL